MALSPLAQHIQNIHESTDFWTLHNIQRVHIDDLERLKAEEEPNNELIASVMRVINAYGEVLDERDGTTRA